MIFSISFEGIIRMAYLFGDDFMLTKLTVFSLALEWIYISQVALNKTLGIEGSI